MRLLLLSLLLSLETQCPWRRRMRNGASCSSHWHRRGRARARRGRGLSVVIAPGVMRAQAGSWARAAAVSAAARGGVARAGARAGLKAIVTRRVQRLQFGTPSPNQRKRRWLASEPVSRYWHQRRRRGRPLNLRRRRGHRRPCFQRQTIALRGVARILRALMMRFLRTSVLPWIAPWTRLIRRAHRPGRVVVGVALVGATLPLGRNGRIGGGCPRRRRGWGRR